MGSNWERHVEYVSYTCIDWTSLLQPKHAQLLQSFRSWLTSLCVFQGELRGESWMSARSSLQTRDTTARLTALLWNVGCCIYCSNHFSVCCVCWCVCVFFSGCASDYFRWISKFICKSVLHFHCGKNWNDQSLERPINKVLGCWFIGRHCGTIASQIISPLTATF